MYQLLAVQGVMAAATATSQDKLGEQRDNTYGKLWTQAMCA